MLILDAENLKNTNFLHVKKMVNFGFSARIIGVMTRSDYAWLAAMRVRSRASPHSAELQGRALAIRKIFTLDFYAWHKNLHKKFFAFQKFNFIRQLYFDRGCLRKRGVAVTSKIENLKIKTTQK